MWRHMRLAWAFPFGKLASAKAPSSLLPLMECPTSMADQTLKIFRQSTRFGTIALTARSDIAVSGFRPVVVMIHGALRSSALLHPWRSIFEPAFDVVFADLP